ncbi:MAG: hypothetical protein K8T90_18080, partial [Planctomycetes bacterium]|nr:hypothetical protein [Planctomycetota bacterium]
DAGARPVTPPDRLERVLTLHADAPWFAGHFPGEPILPGMCHIEFAASVVRDASDAPLALAAVVRARFSRKVVPGEELRIELRREASPPGADGETWRSVHTVNGERAADLVLAFVSRR